MKQSIETPDPITRRDFMRNAAIGGAAVALLAGSIGAPAKAASKRKIIK